LLDRREAPVELLLDRVESLVGRLDALARFVVVEDPGVGTVRKHRQQGQRHPPRQRKCASG
jgi:hypothetical protein